MNQIRVPPFASLDEAISNTASIYPEKLFIRDLSNPEKIIERTYREAEALICKIASEISKIEGNKVGISLSTSFECICLVYGVIRAGKSPVLIDPEWGELSKASIIKEMNLRRILSDKNLRGIEAEYAMKIDFQIPESLPKKFASAGKNSRIFIFTSGTTSRPKGIELTQEAMMYCYSVGQACLGIGPQTNAGCFYRVSGLGILGIHFLFPMLFGGSTTILPTFLYFNPGEFFAKIRELGINFLYIVPPIVNFLAKEGTPLSQKFSYNEVLCVAGSSRLDRRAQNDFQSKFGPIANIYGLSECGFAFLFGQKRDGFFTNSVGVPIGIELKLMDEEGNIVRKPETVGRLYVKTQSLFEGYVGNQELTAALVKDGWLDTKDSAWFDENGYFYLVGRTDNTIKKGGNLFHLAEAEAMLNGLEEVVESCCVKVPCEIYGEDYIAFVRLKSPEYIQILPAIVEKGLGVTRAPRRFVVWHGDLPRNGAGKYDTSLLLQQEK